MIAQSPPDTAPRVFQHFAILFTYILLYALRTKGKPDALLENKRYFFSFRHFRSRFSSFELFKTAVAQRVQYLSFFCVHLLIENSTLVMLFLSDSGRYTFLLTVRTNSKYLSLSSGSDQEQGFESFNKRGEEGYRKIILEFSVVGDGTKKSSSRGQ